MHRTDVKPRAEVLAEMAAWLDREHKIKVLGGLGFENAYALAMPRARAQALGIRTLADLAGRAQSLSIAGDYEFFGRPEWAAVAQDLRHQFPRAAADAAGVHVCSGGAAARST